MTKRSRAGGTFFGNLATGAADGSLYRQIYGRLRTAILDGHLAPGTRLPSTRTLASEMSVSRTTAEEVYSQLDAEGFVERRVGDGTYVAAIDVVRTPRRARPAKSAPGTRRLATRMDAMERHPCFPEAVVPRAFAAGSPAVDHFPMPVWRSIVARCLRRFGERSLRTGDPAGHGPLREAIATYLNASRGVRCTAEQIVVVMSSQQALDLAVRLVVDPGDAVWLEDPAYPGAAAALLANAARIVPVPVDDDGMRVDDGVRLAPDARLAFVTPSHQFPTGTTLSLERRLALLDWARRTGAWILEDDYDSEFRYDGRPLAALQGIDDDDRVIYVGTFTKLLFPGLRLAYAVLPRDLVQPFITARGLIDGFAPPLPQMAATEFFAEGHFGVHIRRMRELYRERRDALVESADRWLGSRVELGPAEAGLHVMAKLVDRTGDRAVSERAAKHGVFAEPISRYHMGPVTTPGLFLGFAAVSSLEIREGVRKLSRAL
jgi:GntR family transcriptional regulator / MocR family aminotransferase